MGKRGPQPGVKYQKTIDKALAREALRRIVLKHMDRMTRAQIASATGIGHVYTRDKHGKFNKIENEQAADELLTKGTEGQDYWIFMKDPSTAAFTDLMNRALDKPIEPVEMQHSGGIEVSWKGDRPASR